MVPGAERTVNTVSGTVVVGVGACVWYWVALDYFRGSASSIKPDHSPKPQYTAILYSVAWVRKDVNRQTGTTFANILIIMSCL